MLMFAIVLYVFVGELIAKNHRAVDPVLYRALSVMAVVEVIAIFAVHRVVVSRTLGVLAADIENKAGLMRWRAGLIITFALCLAVALFGLVVRILGASSSQAAPFYISGALLMLYFVPRRPASNEVAASASTMG
jgi:F0F1-type ATP synthase membrane subunit c/vacuolar-type H+-ATPase subunit K